uniref:Orange domain-containing protein n=1 Tax=Timema genevievae TaxID=629358 RepID=A0A7R9JXD3_TIMGE|nr:unnamed protein product [Timema genevievae]
MTRRTTSGYSWSTGGIEHCGARLGGVAGFSQCAAEACQFLLTLPDLDFHVGRRLVAHLGQVVSAASPIPLTVQVPSAPRLCYSPPVSPASDAPPPPPRGGETPPPPALSSTPSAQDLARPMQGLLMTVHERRRGRSSPSSTERRDMWRPW